MMRGTSVEGTKDLECRSNGQIILGGAVFEKTMLFVVLVFLVVLRAVGLVHCWYKYSPWS